MSYLVANLPPIQCYVKTDGSKNKIPVRIN